MASRDDVEIYWHLSPRLVLVKTPSDNISIQDLHDTLRDKEQEPQNLIYPHLIDTTGGQNLGGGITVGLTAELKNARLGFQAHKEFVASGLVTADDLDGKFLIDTSTTFSGIIPASWVINLDDGSIATILNVDSNTMLRTDGLGGGLDNAWQIGDRYKILAIRQVEVDGGNLVAVDTLNNEIDAIFSTAGNQVIRTSASSATQRSSEQLEHSTFEGVITIDAASPYSGTKYPVGTPGYPVNNIEAAHTIGEARGIKRFKIIGNFTLDSPGLDLSGHVFQGHSAITSIITVSPNVFIENTEFNNCTVQGTLDGGAVIREARILDLNYLNGFLFQCALDGTITLGGGAQAAILSCYSNIAGGVNTAVIDMSGGGQDLIIRDYNGGIELRNCSTAITSSIDMSSGQVIISPTVANGNFTIRGICKVTDNSTGSAVVDSSQILQGDVRAADTFWTRPLSNYADSTTMGGYIRNKILSVAKFLGLK